MASRKAKKQWDATMAKSGIIAKSKVIKKRSSGRTIKLSKSMKTVDEETRSTFRTARIDALEADNYNEHVNGEQDEEYIENDAATDGSKSRKRQSKKSKKGGSKRKLKTVKKLAQFVFEEWGKGEEDQPNYISIAALPSKKPPRYFCCVCGYPFKFILYCNFFDSNLFS